MPTRSHAYTRIWSVPAFWRHDAVSGSFVSATPEQARTPREHDRRLRAFVTRVLADAEAAGFTIEDVTGPLGSHQQGEA